MCVDMRPDSMQKPENRGKVFPKRYIGETGNFKERKRRHYNKVRKGGKTPLCDYLRTVSEEYYRWVIIADGLTEKQAKDKEIELIKFYDTNVCRGGKGGYNATDGGEGVSGYTYTEEQCKARSERMKGEKNPNWRRQMSWSEEHKRRLSKTMTGKKLSPEHVENRTRVERMRLLNSLATTPMRCIQKIGNKYQVAIQSKYHGLFPTYEEARAYVWKWYLAFYL